ncbi:MAG: efflux RND transporter periplasmic adaptor subunit [Succinivibrionaceae bacterium]|nr:efflux RND transporter periplasmic adaptor subunit [Succinivibrionaceae bacterium]
MKKIIIILIVAALAGAGYFYFFKPKAPSDLRFMTTHVTKGNIVSRVLATGTLEGYKQVSVGAQVSGQLQKLYVDAGDEVKQGQLLAQIDSRTQQNALKDAQSQLNTYKAQLVAKQATLKRATLEFNRQQNMLKRDASAKADFEAAEASLAQAKADVNVVEQQIKQAEIKVDTAKINVGYTKIEAPIDGTVIAIVTDEGQTVVSNQTATTILKLATMDTMTVKAEISEADVIKIKPGMEVEFTILGDPKRVFKSTLKKIAPAPQSASSSSNTTTSSTSTAIYYNAEFDVPNDDRVLRVSMTAECSIILAQKKDVLIVPITAVKTDHRTGKSYAMVLRKGGPQRVDVELGLRDQTNVEVISGLTERDVLTVGDDVESAENAALANHQSRRRGPPRL